MISSVGCHSLNVIMACLADDILLMSGCVLTLQSGFYSTLFQRFASPTRVVVYVQLGRLFYACDKQYSIYLLCFILL